MKTIIVTREVLDAINELWPYPKLLIRNARKVAQGWELEISDEMYQKALANQKAGESISDVCLRAVRQDGRAGMRRTYQRLTRRKARQRANRRATGL